MSALALPLVGIALGLIVGACANRPALTWWPVVGLAAGSMLGLASMVLAGLQGFSPLMTGCALICLGVHLWAGPRYCRAGGRPSRPPPLPYMPDRLG